VAGGATWLEAQYSAKPFFTKFLTGKLKTIRGAIKIGFEISAYLKD